jgi:hypothetical protein
MPGFLLHLGALVQCAHAGPAQPTVTNPRVTVSGQPIVMNAAPYVVTGCPFVPPAPGPCVSALWVTSAVRVTSNGLPVLLQDSQAVCAPTGTPLVIMMTQVRVKGM